MPLDRSIKKTLVIGSGPIVIGQAAEFDYAGTQACRALREEGIEVVLVNSNPATIMTDKEMADRIYIEPLTIPVIKRIIEKERPDSLLSTLGGQTGLTLSMQLAKEGFLDKMGVRLLGADPETIDKAEDRQLFKDTMLKIGQPCIPSKVVTDLESAIEFASEIGYPLIIRPAFTLGGTGGGIAQDEEQLREIASNGIRLSPINQILVEKCVSGWKEIEFEVIRDSAGNVITVCSMENVDPVGVHTGDSIVVAPAVTLATKEFMMLKTAALSIVSELKVNGGCNVQFALNPNSFEYAVIEVNPRVSRSSALASKATGYPIAKVASKIAVGYNLDEIPNAITKKTSACFEPTVDYIVVKLPKWPFDKFVYAKRTLGTQMKATGEVMAIGTCFEQAIMKAVRGAEISLSSLNSPKLAVLSDAEIRERLNNCDDERLFVVYQALKRGVSVDDVYAATKIDKWFLNKFLKLVKFETELASGIDDEKYLEAKKLGYPDHVIEQLTGTKLNIHRSAVFKMVDTCAAEFAAETPYFYSTYDDDNEALRFKNEHSTDKKTVLVFGAGPIRIGQGIEFDYASVHCCRSLKKLGYEVVIVNNNPETVSTDFDTADRLYFEPLTPEDVMNVIETEKPFGAVVAFGGQTAIKLTNFLDKAGVKIIGTSADSIDAAEDRERFDALLEKYHIKRPVGDTVMTTEEALAVAQKIGYPVLMRPSYVLGGQNMIIAFSESDIVEYMSIILSHNIENPVLIDKYLMGIELEVDAVCDGEDILIPGIMEHIERTGVHSGDSIAVYPAWNVSDELTEKIVSASKQLAVDLNTRGLINIQYLIYENDLYVIEVNPRSSRTVPYITKVTGVPMVDLATRAMLGEKLKDMGFGTGLYPSSPYVAVKVPVFSFEKLADVDNHLGPEMKSTGEVLGIAGTMEESLYKGLIAAGYNMKRSRGVMITVRDSDKSEVADLAKSYSDLGFSIYATRGTANVISKGGTPVTVVDKIHESDENTITLLESGKINYVISTSSKGRIPSRDSVKIRRKTVERSIPCLTSIDTARALAQSLKSKYSEMSIELVDINRMRTERTKLRFTKMEGCGNDYIYFNCFDQKINNPEGLAVRYSDRHTGVGGDGVVLICPSDKADVKIRMFKKDGSESKMFGNAVRCVGKYLYDNHMTDKKDLTVETVCGIKKIKLFVHNKEVSSARVEMGKATLTPASIPVNFSGGEVVDRLVNIGDENYNITCVGIEGPHCIVFVKNVDKLDVQKIGPCFENYEKFPERINAEFVQIIDEKTIKIRTWERGCGQTGSFGTGACAAVVAACENGFCRKGEEITVKLFNGDLKVTYTDENIFMTGDANKIFDGEIII